MSHVCVLDHAGIVCAAGFHGVPNPVAAACSAHNTPYAVTGCVANECVRPPSAVAPEYSFPAGLNETSLGAGTPQHELSSKNMALITSD